MLLALSLTRNAMRSAISSGSPTLPRAVVVAVCFHPSSPAPAATKPEFSAISVLTGPGLTKRTKGNIVNVSSIAGQKVYSENCMSYSVSKAGLDHFTRCAALDLAASGVRVNSVNPGPVRTDIIKNAGLAAPGADDELWKQEAATTAFGRVGEPEEIADLIAFLASDKAKSITGSIYASDNGYMLK